MLIIVMRKFYARFGRNKNYYYKVTVAKAGKDPQRFWTDNASKAQTFPSEQKQALIRWAWDNGLKNVSFQEVTK